MDKFIYKLKYTSKEEADADLLAKGIVVNSEDGVIDGDNTWGVVHVSKFPIVQATFDEEGNQLTEAVFEENCHPVDVMLKIPMKFDNEIFPKNPTHSFGSSSNLKIEEDELTAG